MKELQRCPNLSAEGVHIFHRCLGGIDDNKLIKWSFWQKTNNIWHRPDAGTEENTCCPYKNLSSQHHAGKTQLWWFCQNWQFPKWNFNGTLGVRQRQCARLKDPQWHTLCPPGLSWRISQLNHRRQNLIKFYILFIKKKKHSYNIW